MAVGESMAILWCQATPAFLLMTGGSLIWLGAFSVEAFECSFQVDPSYFKGIPLSDQKFVFDVPLDATRNVAESRVKRLS